MSNVRGKIEFSVAGVYLAAFINDELMLYDEEERKAIASFMTCAYALVPPGCKCWWTSDPAQDTSFVACEVSEKRAQCYTIYLNYRSI